MPLLNICDEMERLSRLWASYILICREQRACREQGGLWFYKANLGPVFKRGVFLLTLSEVLIQTRTAVYTCRYTPHSCGTRPEMSSVGILLPEKFPMERRIKYKMKCY